MKIKMVYNFEIQGKEFMILRIRIDYSILRVRVRVWVKASFEV